MGKKKKKNGDRLPPFQENKLQIVWLLNLLGMVLIALGASHVKNEEWGPWFLGFGILVEVISFLIDTRPSYGEWYYREFVRKQEIADAIHEAQIKEAERKQMLEAMKNRKPFDPDK